MNRAHAALSSLSCLALGIAAAAAACSSTSSGAALSGDGGSESDAAPIQGSMDGSSPADAGPGDAGPGDAGPAADGGPAITTIAAAIQGNVTTPITVNAIITAEHGSIPNDVSQWYIEDLGGGPHSGVVVYCDPDLTSCPASIRAPARWTLVQMTGTLSPYKGQMEFIPTAQTILGDAGTPPPIPTVTMSDVAPSASSDYRGVLVKIAAGTTLTVDDVTPPGLLDTECDTVIPTDAGADASSDAGGLISCSSLCEPPAYSGFTANDGNSNEVNIEANFFATDPLQSSPECLTQPGVTPVTVGATFTSMQGVLDYDPYAKQQELSPVTPSDYTLQ